MSDFLLSAGRRWLASAIDHLRLRLPDDPIPDSWRAITRRNVPLAHRLDAIHTDRLLHIAQLLLREIPFEGCGGVDLTDEIRVTIAVTASLLLLGLPYPRFAKLSRVIVYPTAFVPERMTAWRGSAVEDESVPVLRGEAWRDGIVVLSLAGVMEDASESDRARSVVLHEFAHVLDAEDGQFNGSPVLDDSTQAEAWDRAFADAFERASADDFPLDAYAAKNRSELFAVATEAFFSVPLYLQPRLPAVYEQLTKFYGWDPASDLR